MNTSEINRPAIGIALSGGAAHGIAHLGVMQALEDHDIKPDLLSGTSVGAMIGALYAFGITVVQLKEIAEKSSWTSFSGFKLSMMGLLTNAEIGKLLAKHIGDKNIEDARMPLAFIATDIVTGEKIVFRSGSVIDAVMASTCVPGVYTPVKIGERMLVDGVLVENLPVTPLREMGADILIGVDLGVYAAGREPDNIFDVLMNSFNIAIDQINRKHRNIADIVISPEVAQYSRTSSKQFAELFSEGYRAAVRSIPAIHAKISEKTAVQKPPLLKRLGRLFG